MTSDSLAAIAAETDTVTEEQRDDDHDRLDTSDMEKRDVGTEYDGGWSTDH